MGENTPFVLVITIIATLLTNVTMLVNSLAIVPLIDVQFAGTYNVRIVCALHYVWLQLIYHHIYLKGKKGRSIVKFR